VRNCPQCGASYDDEIAYCPNDGAKTSTVASAADPFIGLTIDRRYYIEARIGEGGMGVVYRATHVVLKKSLAIKVMRGEQANDPEIVQRFVQEARASSAIGHPNIVNISDFGTTPDGAVYFAMEYLHGQTLGQAMAGGVLARERAFSIFVQIASALEAAHDAGIIHRDLKPDNIFLTVEAEHRDFVKLLDFGIAKVKNAAAKITRTGMVFGTPHYMSPEQAAGQSVDHRSDIYSLGVIMFQVFAGQLPFDAESYMGVMTKHMFEPSPRPSSVSLELRGPIEDILLKVLQKKPEQRYQTMRELRDDLERAQSGLPPLASARERTQAALLDASGTAPSLPQVAPPAPLLAARTLDSIAIPKQRRSLWLWLLAGALLLGLGAVSFGSFGAPRGDVSLPAAQPVASAADSGTPAKSDAAAVTLPPPPSASDAAASQVEPAPPALHEPAKAPRRSAPATESARSKPAPAAEKPRAQPSRLPPAQTEIVDPWH
jgi:eukaryotic-like serine/threonine-protein kinase